MDHPNLLFVYTDEQSFNTLAAYGNDQIEMPFLNRLAQQSAVFDRAYVTQPVCTPSRSSLLTGLYPHTSGCVSNNISLPLQTPCLPEMVTRGDYVTGHIGKWHLGDEAFAQHGFDHWVSIEDNYHPYYGDDRDRTTRSSYHDFLIERGRRPQSGETFSRSEAARLPEDLGKPAFIAQAASRFIGENRNRPFILYVNFLEPHMPFFGPRDDQYDHSQIPLPLSFDPVDPQRQPLKVRAYRQAFQSYGESGLPLRTRQDWQRLIANYWGLCSLVDTHVGTILSALDRHGLGANTVVVFTSDHGDMMGAQRLAAKCVMFEPAIRVPLMLRLPGNPRPRRVPGPVSQIDLVPTLLDLLGQRIPDHLQGQSLRARLESDAPASSAQAFVEWNGPNSDIVGESEDSITVPPGMEAGISRQQLVAAVTDPVRTLIRPDGCKFNYSTIGEHELYDLKADPHEIQNLYPDQAEPALLRELADEIRIWQEQTGDRVELPPLD